MAIYFTLPPVLQARLEHQEVPTRENVSLASRLVTCLVVYRQNDYIQEMVYGVHFLAVEECVIVYEL